jgi:hypothetical protein
MTLQMMGVLITSNMDIWNEALDICEILTNSLEPCTSWPKTKLENIGSGPSPNPVLMRMQTVDPVTKLM